jgi:hypothetical protein
MNQAQQQAIKTAIGNAEDNLFRAQLQKKSDPNYRSGNGDTIDEMISGYQKQVDELKGGN